MEYWNILHLKCWILKQLQCLHRYSFQISEIFYFTWHSLTTVITLRDYKYLNIEDTTTSSVLCICTTFHVHHVLDGFLLWIFKRIFVAYERPNGIINFICFAQLLRTEFSGISDRFFYILYVNDPSWNSQLIAISATVTF